MRKRCRDRKATHVQLKCLSLLRIPEIFGEDFFLVSEIWNGDPEVLISPGKYPGIDHKHLNQGDKIPYDVVHPLLLTPITESTHGTIALSCSDDFMIKKKYIQIIIIKNPNFECDCTSLSGKARSTSYANF